MLAQRASPCSLAVNVRDRWFSSLVSVELDYIVMATCAEGSFRDVGATGESMFSRSSLLVAGFCFGVACNGITPRCSLPLLHAGLCHHTVIKLYPLERQWTSPGVRLGAIQKGRRFCYIRVSCKQEMP
jgi:hypothetical protein